MRNRVGVSLREVRLRAEDNEPLMLAVLGDVLAIDEPEARIEIGVNVEGEAAILRRANGRRSVVQIVNRPGSGAQKFGAHEFS